MTLEKSWKKMVIIFMAVMASYVVVVVALEYSSKQTFSSKLGAMIISSGCWAFSWSRTALREVTVPMFRLAGLDLG